MISLDWGLSNCHLSQRPTHRMRGLDFHNLKSDIVAIQERINFENSSDRILIRGKYTSAELGSLLFFVIACGLDGYLRTPNRNRRQEKRTVVTSHAGVASHNLDEEEATDFIVPRSWPGRIYVRFAAIRAVLQANPAHSNETLKPRGQPIDIPRFRSTSPRVADSTHRDQIWTLCFGVIEPLHDRTDARPEGQETLPYGNAVGPLTCKSGMKILSWPLVLLTVLPAE